VSYAASKGPFVYTLIPFFAMVAIFAAVGHRVVAAILAMDFEGKAPARVSYCVFARFC